MTIDNEVVSASYNETTLDIAGQLDSWPVMKTFSFDVCSREYPGTITIAGANQESSNHCFGAGMVLRCSSEDIQSPWNGFVSDDINWSDDNGDAICTNEAGIVAVTKNDPTNFITIMIANGAKKIWTEAKEVSLIGTPPGNFHPGHIWLYSLISTPYFFSLY